MTDTPAPQITDTPVVAPRFPPPSTMDQWKAFVGDLARPFAVIVTSAGASASSVIISTKVDDFGNAALFIGAVFAGVGALYGAKAWENSVQAKQSASVEIAKAATTTS